MKFIDREAELRWLEERWGARDPQLLIVYGKRRVGKTELLKQFIRNKPAVYLLADRRPDRDQLKEVATRLGAHFDDAFIGRKGFDDWLEAFEYLKAKLSAKRAKGASHGLALVIDECPYLVENNPATSSLFQKGWDETLSRLPICLILCGSSMAMMESEALAQRAPLYGRRSGDLLIQPLDFSGVRQFLPKHWSFEKCVEVYAMLGGMPGYLRQFDPKANLEENVREKILTPGGFLFREVDFLLREELREPRNYLAILRAVGQGKRKFGEITNDTGMPKNVLHKYLHVLEDLRLILREVPVTEKAPQRSKRSLYGIQDPFITSWFECVYPFVSDLALGETGLALQRFRQVLPHLLNRAYERIARELVRKCKTLPFPLQRAGRWWDHQDEIDVVGINEEANGILFGEVKWSSRPIGTNILEDLTAKATHVQWGRKGRREAFALFSRSGFTPDMLKVARHERILLFERDRQIM
ncbi:MAG: ATP-binding protein [Candidatus Rokubacteria bacterium]|nr:ATP-binding protein [Candidatus Rokubacteria bacterium]